MKPVSVRCVIKEPITSRYILLLESVDRAYMLPINIGMFEAEAIYTELHDIVSPRPMTYDFISGILSAIAGLSIDRVVVDDVVDGVYTAKLVFNHDETSVSVDCRPSDAVALALRLKCDIFVDEKIMQQQRMIDKNCMDKEDHTVLDTILDDHGTTFWNA